MTKVDLFNAKNSSKPVEDGLEIALVDVGSFEDVDKDSHPVTVSVLKDVSGEIYCSISATIAKSLDLLSEIIAENNGTPVKVVVVKATSNNGREFYQLKIEQ